MVKDQSLTARLILPVPESSLFQRQFLGAFLSFKATHTLAE